MFSLDSGVAPPSGCCHAALMLADLYIEALLADEETAFQWLALAVFLLR